MPSLSPKVLVIAAASVAVLGISGIVVTVLVARSAANVPPTITFTASATSVQAGRSANLRWQTIYASSCAASGDWNGEKGPEGSEYVYPQKSSSYVLTCTGPAGTTAATATIDVTATTPPGTVRSQSPIVRFAAVPSHVTTGQRVQLDWSTVNATACIASGDWSGDRTTSGAQSIYPTKSSAFVLTCVGAGGSASATATVTAVAGDASYMKLFDTVEYRIEVVAVTAVNATDTVMNVEIERASGGRKTISTGSFSYDRAKLKYFRCGTSVSAFAITSGTRYRISATTTGDPTLVAIDAIEMCA